MRLLNALRLLVSPAAPTSGAAAGAVYYDSLTAAPLYHNGSTWKPFQEVGFPDPLIGSYTVPDGHQVTYFNSFVNDGVLTITGSGYLVGIR